MINFNIDGVEWELNIVSPDEISGLGETDYCKFTINIVEGLKDKQFKRTLVHEMTHAFRWTYGLVSELDLLNIPSGEVEEYIANTVEVFGSKILAAVENVYEFMLKNEGKNKNE